ncbi:type I-E CRISPR-associated protein Cse1/CasA [Curvibacter sp. RS43]|uniref:type I-E CRISPR-associated protein Cse1/CasA n=1 Tax=Curvibacter microcysteis TaxID=3026419 RepID=UPI002360DA38|nr:type I-E CRISPR-associated protein Cse1/CasA [Curvibacter sp. RS43]MDD0811733.1 type I-E CRISPR-associated protein Cse1/CasA [Curvibacter sp. RS43]
MNLLTERWMPVRTHGGQRRWVAPIELASPEWAAFDADRADFNGALAQFAIGLLQTALPVDGVLQWRKRLMAPPQPAELEDALAPLAAAFEWDAEGARFMQDFDLRAGDGEPLGIGALLIESPGENTVKNNSDLFVKRGHVQALCDHCAALALFTLQLNAPSGGAGHRTGLRGGGPLTTLLVAEGTGAEGPHSLWHTLWLNVLDRAAFEALGGDADKSELYFTFPWLSSITRLQKADGQLTPAQVHPAHVFWAMPRRIRLDLEAVSPGCCDVCGRESSRLISRYVTRNYGLNYKGAWSHPLSPYYESKEGMLPLHPQPDGLGYRHWLGWVLGMQRDKRHVARAAVIERFFSADRERRTGVALRLWAFGYDMDNMKPRCWYDATLPLYALGECSVSAQQALRDDVGGWLAGAELAASYLRGAVKGAWFSHDARGDLTFVDASFWSRTERPFYELLSGRIEAARAEQAVLPGEAWLRVLQNTARHLFDAEWVGAGPVERQNPARIAQAHRQLVNSLNGPKLRAALGLPQTESAIQKTKGKSKDKTKGAPGAKENE